MILFASQSEYTFRRVRNAQRTTRQKVEKCLLNFVCAKLTIGWKKF